MADGVFVVFGFDYCDRNAGFPIKDIVGELLFLLIAGRHVAPDHNGAGRESHFAANLSQLIPPGIFNRRRDKQIANVYFAEFFFVDVVQNEPYAVDIYNFSSKNINTS